MIIGEGFISETEEHTESMKCIFCGLDTRKGFSLARHGMKIEPDFQINRKWGCFECYIDWIVEEKIKEKMAKYGDS